MYMYVYIYIYIYLSLSIYIYIYTYIFIKQNHTTYSPVLTRKGPLLGFPLAVVGRFPRVLAFSFALGRPTCIRLSAPRP